MKCEILSSVINFFHKKEKTVENISQETNKVQEPQKLLNHLSYKSGLEKIARDFSLSDKQIEAITKITIPDTVTEIGDAAFIDFINLKEIIIPNSVVKIGKLAFKGTSLKRVTLPDSVVELGEYAFFNCRALKYVKLSDSMKVLNQNTFLECRALEEVVFPQKIEEIKNEAFSKCSALKSIMLPESVSIIEYGVFSDCENLERIVLPQNLKIISRHLFDNCQSLKEITIPSACEKIDYCAFSNCKALSEITIPDSVTELGQRAFNGCNNLSKIQLSKSIKIIERDLFSLCKSLEVIDLHEGIIEIKENAFDHCKKLKSLTIPESLKEFGYSDFYRREYKAEDIQFHFACNNFPSITYKGEYLKVENEVITLSLIRLAEYIQKHDKDKSFRAYVECANEAIFDMINIMLNDNKTQYLNQNSFPYIFLQFNYYFSSNNTAKVDVNLKDYYYMAMRTKEKERINHARWIECLAKNMDNNNLEQKELYLKLLQDDDTYKGPSVTERFEL